MDTQQRRRETRMWIVAIIFVIGVLAAGAVGVVYAVCWGLAKANWRANDTLLAVRQWCDQHAGILIFAAGVVVALVLYETVKGLYRRRHYGEPFVFFTYPRR